MDVMNMTSTMEMRMEESMEGGGRPMIMEQDRESVWRYMWLWIRRLYVQNRRLLLTGTGAVFCFPLVAGILIGLPGTPPEIAYLVFLFFAPLASAILCSLLFGDMTRKENRTATLMTPVPALSSFLPRLGFLIFGTSIIVVENYFAVMAGRVTGGYLGTDSYIGFQNILGYMFDYQAMPVMLLVSVFFVTNSVFFYGSILWPKWSFFKTLAAIMVLNMVQSMVSTVLLVAWPGYIESVRELVVHHTGPVIWSIVGTDFAFSVLFCWLAWRRYRRSTVNYGLRQK